MKKQKTKRVQRLVRIREVRLIGVELVLSRLVDLDARAFAKLERVIAREVAQKEKRTGTSE